MYKNVDTSKYIKFDTPLPWVYDKDFVWATLYTTS